MHALHSFQPEGFCTLRPYCTSVFDICVEQIGHIGVCCAVASPLASVKAVSA